MPQEMEKKIQSEQRNKNKMKRKRKPRLVESTEDCIKRRVNSVRFYHFYFYPGGKVADWNINTS